MENVFIGRQPIFDRDIQVVGYELLYRSEDMNRAVFLDGNQATSAVMANTFMEIGLERLVGNKLAFINMTREFLLGKFPLPPLNEKIILEVLEDIHLDDEIIEALKVLTNGGFRIALDDVVNPDDVRDIVKMATIIKIDLMRVDRTQLEAYIKRFRKHQLKLLAEKVETQDEFDFCKNLGFDLFQGYFLSKPKIIQERKLSNTRMAILKLLADLQSPSIEFSKIENIIRRDVSLSYKLLKLINSAFYARAQEIKSIKQALTLLGLKQIRSWVNLLLISETENKPPELIVTAMVRGRMAELMAEKLGEKDSSETYFTVGLFSVLDALMDLEMSAILQEVPLAQGIKSALLEREGDLGVLLNCILAYERGEWQAVNYKNLTGEGIKSCYLEALKWSDEVGALLSPPNSR